VSICPGLTVTCGRRQGVCGGGGRQGAWAGWWGGWAGAKWMVMATAREWGSKAEAGCKITSKEQLDAIQKYACSKQERATAPPVWQPEHKCCEKVVASWTCLCSGCMVLTLVAGCLKLLQLWACAGGHLFWQMLQPKVLKTCVSIEPLHPRGQHTTTGTVTVKHTKGKSQELCQSVTVILLCEVDLGRRGLSSRLRAAAIQTSQGDLHAQQVAPGRGPANMVTKSCPISWRYGGSSRTYDHPQFVFLHELQARQ
jgi:hypothetical protein